jgi:hypothetical protein
MVADTIAQTMIKDIVLPRFGILEKDEAGIEAAAGKLERQLKLTTMPGKRARIWRAIS